jgi:hypothetical protein
LKGRESAGEGMKRQLSWRIIAVVATLLVLCAIAAFVVYASKRLSVTVRNDTGSWVRVAGCGSDADDVNAGATFVAEGVPKHGFVFCLVTPEAARRSRCVGVPTETDTPGDSKLLSLKIVPRSRCE